MNTLDRSIEGSPGRVPLYLVKSNLLLNFNQKEEAVEIIEYAKSLNPKMPEAYCQLSHFYFISGNPEMFVDNFRICAELGGFKLMNWREFLKAVEQHYYEKGDLEFLIEFFEIVLTFQIDDVDILSKLAVAYYESGDLEKAEDTARSILEIDSNYQKDVDLFLEKMREASEGGLEGEL